MANIYQITLPSGNVYNLKDLEARQDIENLKSSVTGAMHYIGVTSSELSDGDATNPIVIAGNNVTPKSGDVAISGQKEFVFSDSDNKWHEYGSTGSLKALAFKDTASGNYTPHGEVSQPTFNGNTLESTGKYTPDGTVETNVDLNTTVVNSIDSVGILPSCTFPAFTATVENENLTLSWAAGTFSPGELPVRGKDTTVATTVKQVTSDFTGTEGDLTVSGKPSGTVSKPTFTGTQDTVIVS